MAETSGGLTKLVSRGLPEEHPLAQTVGDGLSSPGTGREEEQRGSLDSATAGGRQADSNFSKIPLMGPLLRKQQTSPPSDR